MANVFISYSREDAEFTERLRDALVAQRQDVWVDWRSIPYTADWLAEIRSAIEACDVLLFVITPDSLASEMCRREFTQAKRSRKRVVPVLRRTVSDADTLPALKAIQWIPLQEEDNFETGVSAVVEAIHTDLAWVRDHTRLLARVREWRRKRRHQSLLLRGKDLVHAIRWLARATELNDRRPTPLHSEYIETSQRHEAQDRKRLEDLYAATLARQLAAQALLARTEIDYRKPMTSHTTLELAATQGLESTDALISLERCLLLGVESIRRSPSVEADAALRDGCSILRRPSKTLSHPEFIDVALYSPDGRYLATSGWDGYARIWKVGSWRRIAVLADDQLRGIAFSPNTQYFATFGPRHGRVWSVRGWKAVGSFNGASSAQFSPDGRYLVVNGEDCVIRPSESTVDTEVITLDQRVVKVAISPCGELVATGGVNDGVRLWKLPSGEQVAALSHSKGIDALAFSPDGSLLATSDKGGAYLWEVRSAARIAYLDEGTAIGALAFSADGRHLAIAGGANYAAQIWDVASKVELRPIGAGYPASELAFGPNGVLATWGAAHSIIRIWDVSSGSALAVLKHVSVPTSVGFSPDGSEVATAGKDNALRIWPVRDNAVSGSLRDANVVRAIAFSSDGENVALACTDRRVHLWEGKLTKQIGQLDHDGEVFDVEFSPDGRHVVTSGEHTVSVWDVAKGTRLRIPVRDPFSSRVCFGAGGDCMVLAREESNLSILRLPDCELIGQLEHPAYVGDFAISPDGRWLGSGGTNNEVIVWDLLVLRIVARVANEGPVTKVAFSADSRYLASVGGTDVVISKPETGEEVRRLGHIEDAYLGAFSPDGKYFACASVDDSAYVHNLSTGTWRRLRHADTVCSIAFSPDGAAVATASKDETTRVWRLSDRKEIVRLQLGGGVSEVCFSPDGRWLATLSQERARFHLWRPNDLVAEACGRVSMNLTPDEWRQYLGAEPYRKTCPELP